MLKNPIVVDNQVPNRETVRLEDPASLAHAGECEKRAAIRGLQERHLVMEEHPVSQHFRSYFNNKMTLLLFLVQAQGVKPNLGLAQTVRAFLDGLYCRLPDGLLRRKYRLVFKWLTRFFEKLPEVSVYQRDRAKELIRSVYDAFGLHLKDDI